MNSELIQRMRDAADTIDDADKLVPMEYGYWNSTQLREYADEWASEIRAAVELCWRKGEPE